MRQGVARGLAWFGWLLWSACACAGFAWAQEEAQVALLPVVYGEARGEPLVGPLMPDLAEGMTRAWNGPVLSSDALRAALERRWVWSYDPSKLRNLEEALRASERAFEEDRFEEAIALLEKIVQQGDVLLAQVSADPRQSRNLLRAHLLLWWALDETGERDRLQALMVQSAERFPAGAVESAGVPPKVAQAFQEAREQQKRGAQTLSIFLKGGVGACKLLLNGSPLGDDRNAGVAVLPGRTYYVHASCGDLHLPPRRIVVDKATAITLDLGLARTLRDTSLGPTLRAEGDPNDTAELVGLGKLAGEVFGVDTVVLAGISQDPNGAWLQLDRVQTSPARRTCSVRLSLDEAQRRAPLDEALRALVANKPTPNTILFAGEDGIYRTPEEYVELVTRGGIPRIFTWVTGGLGLVSLGIGGVFAFVQGQDQAELDLCILDAECRGTVEAERLRGELYQNTSLSWGFSITGGALLLGSVALYFIEAPDPEDYLAASPLDGWMPWLTPEGAGLQKMWSW